MIYDILSRCDHTLLNPEATFDDICALIDEAIEYKTATVCIAPAFVKDACDYADGRVKICTVIGFPLGTSTTSSKCFEAREAAVNGADEIDMVINIGFLKEKMYRDLEDEINSVKLSCGRPVKVIIETCLLTDEEKIKMCEIVSRSDADYIKTSTGFSTGGATKEDVMLIKANLTRGTKLKAAGGISSIKDAEELIALGADRIGSSKLIKLIREMRA